MYSFASTRSVLNLSRASVSDSVKQPGWPLRDLICSSAFASVAFAAAAVVFAESAAVSVDEEPAAEDLSRAICCRVRRQ